MNELALSEQLRELALFAGAGGGILGGHLLGWRTVCAVEWADYPRRVLLARQRDGMLPRFPIWEDVQTFDGKPWRGRVDVVTGGFPCQDISAAGRGAGIDGERSGMWRHMARIIGEVGPQFVLVENSPLLTIRGLGRVLGDLAAMGYDAEWGVLGACDAGAPHKRDRIWILAYAMREQRHGTGSQRANGRAKSSNRCEDVADSSGARRQTQRHERAEQDRAGETVAASPRCGNWWASEPDVGRVANGVANRMDRLKAIGNGQVPAVVRLAWETLMSNQTQETTQRVTK